MPLTPYPLDSARLETLAARYRSFPLAPLSYATVRDFCDSVELIPELSTINCDMKDVQRPWVLKSILGAVPRGGTLLEIGAGDPHVAHWLSLLGYNVWIVDPYDGSGRGPKDFEFYRDNFPRLKLIRNIFSDDVQGLSSGAFDCIYSISVLEHIPHFALQRVIAGLRKYLRSGGITVHAVDHVLKGAGDGYHLETLRLLGRGLGVSEVELTNCLTIAAEDTETYFLSAEAHNMWRGTTPYLEFPMRRCISVQFALTFVQTVGVG